MYTVYMHTNTITNKSYIGQTKYTMEHRWKGHISGSRNKAKNNHAFANAILKYGSMPWEHLVLHTGLSKEEASAKEIECIKIYDTFNNGYNSTLGGDYFDGYTIPSGDASPHTDTNKYTFYHRYYSSFTGTITEFSLYYNINRASVRSLVNRNSNISMFGWVMSPLDLYFRNGLLKITAPKVSIVDKPYRILCPVCLKATIVHTSKSCLKCRDTSGSNNGMSGKIQTTKAKEAVSNRMRNIYADQTKRNWVHPIYGEELSIRTIDLRDKYIEDKLSISALKKVTDESSNISQHKGWKLSNIK